MKYPIGTEILVDTGSAIWRIVSYPYPEIVRVTFVETNTYYDWHIEYFFTPQDALKGRRLRFPRKHTIKELYGV